MTKYSSKNARNKFKIAARDQVFYNIKQHFKPSEDLILLTMPGPYYNKNKTSYLENQFLNHFHNGRIIAVERDKTIADIIRPNLRSRMQLRVDSVHDVRICYDTVWLDLCGEYTEDIKELCERYQHASRVKFVAITIGGRSTYGRTLENQIQQVRGDFKFWTEVGLYSYQNNRSPMRVLMFARE